MTEQAILEVVTVGCLWAILVVQIVIDADDWDWEIIDQGLDAIWDWSEGRADHIAPPRPRWIIAKPAPDMAESAA